MNKIQFEKLIKPLIQIYDEIELGVIRNILERLENYSSVRGSLEWYLEKLADTGTFDKDVLKILKKNKNKIKRVLRSIISNSARSSEYLDMLESYFNKGLLNVNPLELYNSTAINNIINNTLKDCDDIMNLINTKAIEGANISYKQILNQAYVETASGVYSYDEAIRKALKKYADDGVLNVHYQGGKALSIEGVVRRDVLTRVNQLTTDVDIENCKELDTNLVYVDQHLGARTRNKHTKEDYEAHAEWQGKVYMIEGSSDKYDNLYEKTGLGEMLGLRGINCYHNFRPYFEWEKIPDRIDEVENARAYENLQKQRAYERKIRALKRQKEVDKVYDPNNYRKTSEELKILNNEFDNFLEENDLKRDYSREYIVKRK